MCPRPCRASPPERGIPRQPENRSPCGSFFQGVELAARRFREKGNRERQQEAWGGCDIERKPPTEIGAEFAAEQVSSGGFPGEREVKQATKGGPSFLPRA